MRTTIPATLIFACLTIATPVLALECPVPKQIDDAAVAAAVAKVLPLGIDLSAPNAVEAAVFDLKQAGVSEDLILDNLISSYCQSVAAETGTPDEEKAQKLNEFTQTTEPLVFGNAN